MSDSPPSPPEQLSLRALVLLYERHLQQRELRERTLRTYRSQWSALVEFFGPDEAVASIDAEDLERFWNGRRESGRVSPTTARHDCECLQRLLGFAIEAGYRTEPVPSLVDQGPVEHPDIAPFPSPDDLGARVRRLEDPRGRDRIWAIFVFMATVRELSRIRLKDWNDHSLRLRDSRGRVREVPLVDETLGLLERAARERNEPLFPVPQVDQCVRKFREEHGRPYGASRLGRCLEHHLIEAGVRESDVLWSSRGPWAKGAQQPPNLVPLRQGIGRVLRRASITSPSRQNGVSSVEPTRTWIDGAAERD